MVGEMPCGLLVDEDLCRKKTTGFAWLGAEDDRGLPLMGLSMMKACTQEWQEYLT